MFHTPRTKRQFPQEDARRFSKRFQKGKRKLSVLILTLLILLWSGILGWGLAQVSAGQQLSQAPAASEIETTDVVPQQYQLGQKIYLESCSSCHIAPPPGVLPVETWQQLLQDPQHYGLQITPLVDPPLSLVWNYLQTFSRPQRTEERIPYRIAESRYFKALHPRVKLPQSIDFATCATCHPGVAQYNFRQLTPEWEKAP